MKLSPVLGTPLPARTQPPVEAVSAGRRRCHVCVAVIIGLPFYKEGKGKLPKIKSSCSKCKKTVCPKHMLRVCQDCV